MKKLSLVLALLLMPLFRCAPALAQTADCYSLGLAGMAAAAASGPITAPQTYSSSQAATLPNPSVNGYLWTVAAMTSLVYDAALGQVFGMSVRHGLEGAYIDSANTAASCGQTIPNFPYIDATTRRPTTGTVTMGSCPPRISRARHVRGIISG